MRTPLRSQSLIALSVCSCLLALSTSGCGGENADSGTESASQSLNSACVPAPVPIANATASSQQSAAFAPKFAIDGLSSTRWSSAKNADQWLALDLGKVVVIDSLKINWQTAYSKSFWIESSADGISNWTNVSTSSASAPGVQTVLAPTSTRYVRIHSSVPTTFGNVSVIDVQVLGTVDAVCGNLLKGPWTFSASTITPASIVPTLYSVHGNTIDFTYQGKSFQEGNTTPPTPPIAFKQPVSIVQGGHYRLRLDVTGVSGTSEALMWAGLSGAGPLQGVIGASGGTYAVFDFAVTSPPGPNPVIEVGNTPIMVFPGVGVQDFNVASTLTKTN